MQQANMDVAHKAMQSLKDNSAALEQFHTAISGLSRETGLAFDDPTLTYVANTLINQRNILSHAGLLDQSGTSKVGGFFIKAAIK